MGVNIRWAGGQASREGAIVVFSHIYGLRSANKQTSDLQLSCYCAHNNNILVLKRYQIW